MQRRRTYDQITVNRNPPPKVEPMETFLQTLVNKMHDLHVKVDQHEKLNNKMNELQSKVDQHEKLNNKMKELQSKVDQHEKLNNKMNELAKKNTELELQIIKTNHIMNDTIHTMYKNMESQNIKHDSNLENIITSMTKNNKDIIITTITELLKK